MTDYVASDFAPALAASKQTTVAVAVSSSSSAWGTGDYKVSARSADHADPTGGSWLLCDSSAIDASFAALIALVGGSRPDARGRMLVMQGTNASVSTLLANDGVAVANRRPQHRHTPHSHTLTNVPNVSTAGATNSQWQPGITAVATVASTGTVDGGSGNANDSLDAAAFLVPGNLFIHT